MNSKNLLTLCVSVYGRLISTKLVRHGSKLSEVIWLATHGESFDSYELQLRRLFSNEWLEKCSFCVNWG